MRDKPVFPSLVFRLTPLNTPPLGAGMFIQMVWTPPSLNRHLRAIVEVKLSTTQEGRCHERG